MSRMRTRVGLFLATAVLGLLVAASAASAATFPVNSTVDFPDANTGDTTCADILNRCTLRAAIEQANAQGGPDQVNLPPGTYALGVMGQLTVSTNIVVEGTGTSSNTTIAQTPPGRVIEVTPPGALDLRDATVRDGFLSADGGGILTQGTLTLRRVVVANNEANNENGGGIAIISPASGNTTILDSTIGSPGGGVSGNRAGGTGATSARAGGILHQDGTLTIRGSTIAGNRVDATPGSGAPEAIGGGIATSGSTLVIEDSTVRSNLARANANGVALAAGILNGGGQLTMRHSTVAQNQAVGIGGAAEASIGGIGTGGPGLIEDSTISGNRALVAAGVGHIPASPSQTLTIRRSAVTGNVSQGIVAGAGLVLDSSTVNGNGTGPGLVVGGGTGVVRGSTIAGHGSNPGLWASGATTTTVTGSILDGNAPNCRRQGGGSVVSGGYNVESANSCGFAAAGDQPSTNPLLGPLQANGGPTQTRAIATNSPARDAVTEGCPPPSTDQRGVARPKGAACDSGAFELVPAAPQLELSGKGRQKAKKLKLNVSCGQEACSVELGGKGKVPTRAAVAAKAKKLKLKSKGVDLAGGATETVRLKFKNNRKTVKKVTSLLKRGGKKARKARIVVSGTATGIGGTDAESKKVKLKR